MNRTARHSSRNRHGTIIAGCVCLLLGLMLLSGVRPLHAQPAPISAGVRLQAGIEKEDVDGDLKSAMDIYQKIAADASAPREVRARALLRLAGCEEKLGREAKHVYEQIVHDYGDQPAAAQARKRLALIKQQEHPALPPTMTVRKIEWAELGQMGEMDTDGERATYTTQEGDLYFGDLTGHSRRLLHRADPEYPGGVGWMVSRDFSMVALKLPAEPGRPASVAVMNINGTGFHELTRDDAEGNVLGGSNNFEVAWSWDDRNLLIYRPYEGKASEHLWLISAGKAQCRDFLHPDGFIVKAVFSPDGQSVAYDVWPRDGMTGGKSRVFVAPIQGGEPRLVYESSTWRPAERFHVLKDWTADGRFLAIKDVQQGKSALFLLPIRNRTAAGPAVFIRYGEFESAFTTASGALVYGEPNRKPVQAGGFFASVDSEDRPGEWRHIDLHSTPEGTPRDPSFSSDGSQIVYVAGSADSVHQNVVLWDLATGAEKVLYQTANDSVSCGFSVRSRNVFCSEDEENGGEGESDLISIATDSGVVERIASFPEPRIMLRSPQNDNLFFFSAHDYSPGLPPIILWDRSTGTERVVKGYSKPYILVAPSPDGRWLAWFQDTQLFVQLASGSDARAVVSGIKDETPPEFTPDCKWLLYHAIDSTGRSSLFRISVGGGDPQRLGDYPIPDLLASSVRISPDGSRILAAEVDDITYDLWVLNNFVPPATH